MAERRHLLIVGGVLALVAIIASGFLLTRESQAEKCERLGENAHKTEAAILLNALNENEEELDEQYERAKAAETAYKAAGCKGIPGCDFKPRIYDKERCAKWYREASQDE